MDTGEEVGTAFLIGLDQVRLNRVVLEKIVDGASVQADRVLVIPWGIEMVRDD